MNKNQIEEKQCRGEHGRGVGDNACNWQHFSISAAISFNTGLARNTVHNILQPVNHCDCSLEFRSRSSSIGDCVCFQIHCFFSRLSVCRTARQVKRPGRCPGWSLDSTSALLLFQLRSWSIHTWFFLENSLHSSDYGSRMTTRYGGRNWEFLLESLKGWWGTHRNTESRFASFIAFIGYILMLFCSLSTKMAP